MPDRVIRIGTRGSALALWQANWVADQLRGLGAHVDVRILKTTGDQSQDSSLRGFGGVGVFVKELQRALLGDEIDLAVHSLKDLPTALTDGLTLAAVPPRAAVEDALITPDGCGLDHLAANSRIGTGSARRRAFLLARRPGLQMRDIRGNVDTRIKKLDEGQFDAIVLAAAGLNRLGNSDRVAEILSADWMLPAAGQGALGVETRNDDHDLLKVLAPLNDQVTHAAVAAERSLLAELRAGCLAPVGAWARVEESASPDRCLVMNAAVAKTDGSQRISVAGNAAIDDAQSLGRRLAAALTAEGAAEIIAAERQP